MNKKLFLESLSEKKALTIFKALQAFLNRSDECNLEIRLPEKKYLVIESERSNDGFGLTVIDNEGYLFAMIFETFDVRNLAQQLVKQIKITWTPDDLVKAGIAE